MDKWLNNPTYLKVIAVVIGILIWAVVHIDPGTSPQSVTSSTDTKVIEAATIVPIGLDTDKYMLTAMEPTVARIVVEGRISSLLTANNDDYVVQLDLSNVGPGIQVLPLSVKMPNGIKEVEISPQVVTVQIEELETQTLEVQVLTEGEPAEGYIVGESSIVGDIGNVVEVTMPKDDYARLGMVAVTVDITGAKATVINKKAKIMAYDTQGSLINNVKINPETLSAETIITLPSKEVPLQLRYSGSLPEGFSLVSISTTQQNAVVNALQTTLDNMTIYDGFILDLSKVKESGEVMVKAEKSDSGVTVTPAEIPVKIEIEATDNRVMNGVPVTINGLTDGLKASIMNSSNGRIDVMLKGANTLLQKVKLSDVKLSLDVTDLEIGTHQLTINVELPAYIHAEETEGYLLDVTVNITGTKDAETMSSQDETDEPDENITNNHSPGSNSSSNPPDSSATDGQVADHEDDHLPLEDESIE